MSRPKPPQTYSEMVEQGIAQRQKSRVFSTANRDENDIKISELVTASVEDLARAADEMNTISLSDIKTLKARTLLYVRACADAGNLPTFSGLMRSLGMTGEAGYSYRRNHPESPTAKWLELYHDYCADLLADAGLKGAVHPVFGIFVEKSRNFWRDTITVETVTRDPIGGALSPEELAEKYNAAFSELPEE